MDFRTVFNADYPAGLRCMHTPILRTAGGAVTWGGVYDNSVGPANYGYDTVVAETSILLVNLNPNCTKWRILLSALSSPGTQPVIGMKILLYPNMSGDVAVRKSLSLAAVYSGAAVATEYLIVNGWKYTWYANGGTDCTDLDSGVVGVEIHATNNGANAAANMAVAINAGPDKLNLSAGNQTVSTDGMVFIMPKKTITIDATHDSIATAVSSDVTKQQFPFKVIDKSGGSAYTFTGSEGITDTDGRMIYSVDAGSGAGYDRQGAESMAVILSDFANLSAAVPAEILLHEW